MTDARDDIAFIRRTVEDGRSYAQGRSPDLLVWGVAIAGGYFTTYAHLRGWLALNPDWVWATVIGLAWLYSLRRFVARGNKSARSPMAKALLSVWLGCGFFLTILGFAAAFEGVMKDGWFDAVSAGTIGIAFFAAATLCNLAWMRVVAVCWWVGMLALFLLRHHPEVLPLSGILMLFLLAGPGIALLLQRPARNSA